jgi:hypothetical protein
METTNNQQFDKDAQPANHSLKKSLVIATVAASLGMALGVNVGDVLAADLRMDSPPPSALSRQDKDLVSKQHKDATQLQQSTQQKVNQSKQLKINTQTPQAVYGK